ncbi:MAG: purine-nucleoside phosphorylase [Candidatus Cloacimonetes bacterium]|nr:purine-nucleoside phosphorylase [Candidatus Cloacimonadota bacterium]
MIEAIREARNYLQDILPRTPKVGIVLGTGLSGLASMVKDPVVIPYGEVPHHPVSTAPSHVGQYVFGSLEGVDVLMMQGRLHYYEGYTMQEITFPIRVMQGAGITHLIVTNAAGSLNESMQPGDLVILRDHINFMGTNPLIGPDDPLLGERFPSMHQPYDTAIINKIEAIAAAHNIPIKQGVYTAVSGPSLETTAECHMFVGLGSDLVGMSTVPEVIVGIQTGLKIAGISVVTNLSNIFHSKAHTQEEIRKYAAQAQNNLQMIIVSLINQL